MLNSKNVKAVSLKTLMSFKSDVASSLMALLKSTQKMRLLLMNSGIMPSKSF